MGFSQQKKDNFSNFGWYFLIRAGGGGRPQKLRKLVMAKALTDKNGRFIILKLSFDEQSIVLVNIYAPNDVQQQLKFFSTLNQLLQEFAEEKILIAGDFNCALSPKDKIGGKSVTRKASVIKQIETLCASNNLRDIWRNINPELSQLQYVAQFSYGPSFRTERTLFDYFRRSFKPSSTEEVQN